MSTVKAVNFQHPSATQSNLVLAADGTVSGGLPSANRNLLYNGAMQVAQRGTSTASITTSGYYTADRWQLFCTTLGTWTQSIENDAPTGSGLSKSLRMLCTTADAAPAAADLVCIEQKLEGQDIQRVAKGTASAQQLTLSFWVKSNVTGTYIATLQDQDNSRSVSLSYTISASATWERKVISFPADATGAFDNDNAFSLTARFWLGAGTDRTSGTLATAWQSTTVANLAVGQTNLAAATNNYWQVTGVQLEVGPIASPFQFKSYGQELRECQRYYYKHCSGSSAIVAVGLYASSTEIQTVVPFPVTMRTKPSGVIASGTDYYRFYVNSGTSDFVNSFTLATESTDSAAFLYNTSEASGTSGMAGVIWANNAAASVAFNAEL